MRVFDGNEKEIRDLMKRTGMLQIYAEWVLKGVFTQEEGMKKSAEFSKKYSSKAKFDKKDEDSTIEKYYMDTLKAEEEEGENEHLSKD